MGGRAPLEPSRQSRQIVTRFGLDLDDQVNQLARERGVSRGQVVREAVADYLARMAQDDAKAS